jgi:hypothetical protein
LLAVLLAILLPMPGSTKTPGIEVPAASGASFTLATGTEAAELLGRRDEFVKALSPFDRSARLKTAHPVSEKEFLDFVRRESLDWNADEIKRMSSVLASAEKKLAAFPAFAGTRVVFAKTSGREEGGATYTRGTAVFIPVGELGKSGDELEALVLHEVFHVVSRRNPALRRALYKIVGFEVTDAIELPATFRSRKITNPDAPAFDSVVELPFGGISIRVAPILFSREAAYDPQGGGEFFDYLQFRLMVVEKRDGRWSPVMTDGAPRLLEAKDVPSFFDRIGRNTNYVIHPDEILADNFVFLVQEKSGLPNPEITLKMRRVLKEISR